MAWFVRLKEEDLFLNNVIEAYSENFFDPTFTKSLLKTFHVLVRRLVGQVRLKNVALDDSLCSDRFGS